MQLAAAGHLEAFGIFGVLDAQRHVVAGLAHQAFADLPAGQEFSFLAGEGRIVHPEGHADRGFVDSQGGQGFRCAAVAQGIGNLQVLDAGDGDDVAGLRGFDLDALQAVETQDLQYPRVALAAVAVDHADLLIGLHAAALHAADADHADVGAVVQR